VTAAPTAPEQRLASLDVLRGVALLGVLVENLQHFVQPSYEAFAASPAASGLDRLALWAIRFACDNKVYLLFSFLFGYGVALQLLRAEAAGARFAPLHAWRMAVLLLIGIAHSLVWSGDILTTYAILGLLLLPLRRARPAVLGAAALMGLAIPSLAAAGLALASGPWAEQAAHNAYPFRQACFAFAMFALGLAAGRAGSLADPAAFLGAARPRLAPALLVGIPASAAAAWLVGRGAQGSASASGALLEVVTAVGAPALAFAYAVACIAALGRPRLAAWLLPVSAVGRTALTNYLLQTAIGIGVLARTGLGPFGPITPVSGTALAVAIFALQVAVSRWWLARFRFGPVEWLWRGATYGALPALRIRPSNPV
jgi:uncharacterized protein